MSVTHWGHLPDLAWPRFALRSQKIFKPLTEQDWYLQATFVRPASEILNQPEPEPSLAEAFSSSLKSRKTYHNQDQ
jgi:hypothetical protein